jgi:hypothetical protein
MGQMEDALRAADQAHALLSRVGSLVELGSAGLARAWALAHLGQLDDARSAYHQASTGLRGRFLIEARCEAATIESLYGDLSVATELLNANPVEIGDDDDAAERMEMARLRVAIRQAKIADQDAAAAVGRLRFGKLSAENSAEVRRHSLLAHVSTLLDRPSARRQIEKGLALAEAQGSHLWARYLRLLRVARGSNEALDSHLKQILLHDPGIVGYALETIVGRLDALSAACYEALATHAERYPDRWRSALRQ